MENEFTQNYATEGHIVYSWSSNSYYFIQTNTFINNNDIELMDGNINDETFIYNSAFYFLASHLLTTIESNKNTY